MKGRILSESANVMVSPAANVGVAFWFSANQARCSSRPTAPAASELAVSIAASAYCIGFNMMDSSSIIKGSYLTRTNLHKNPQKFMHFLHLFFAKFHIDFTIDVLPTMRKEGLCDGIIAAHI